MWRKTPTFTIDKMVKYEEKILIIICLKLVFVQNVPEDY